MTLNRLAVLAVQQSQDKPQVQALLEEAWQMAQSSSDQRALAETEWNRAQITSFAWDDPKRAQVQDSLRSGRRALALSKEIKNLWAQILSTVSLMSGLLEAGEYEEALGLLQHAVALARTLPLKVIFHFSLSTLGSVYHLLQQWE